MYYSDDNDYAEGSQIYNKHNITIVSIEIIMFNKITSSGCMSIYIHICNKLDRVDMPLSGNALFHRCHHDQEEHLSSHSDPVDSSKMIYNKSDDQSCNFHNCFY